jgi:Uma2 family endonuclease
VVAYPEPFDLFVPGAEPVQPDLQVLLPGGRVRVGGRGVEGPPDLVVEILRPSNRRHDLLTKRALYAKAGVREYWIVDPDERTVSILVLAGEELREDQVATADDAVSSPLLPAASFPTAALFAGLDDLDPAP